MAGTTRLTARNVKPGTAAREVQAKKMVDTGIVGVGCESNFASRSRCPSCGVVRGRYQQQQGQSGRKPQFTQSTFAAVVAEEAAKLHAQLGQGAIDVPMMETGQNVAPIGGGRTRAIAYSVGEPGCIHCSSNAGRGGRRGRVPDSSGQAGEAQAGPGSALGPQTAQDQAQSGPRGSREGKQEIQGVDRGGGVHHGSTLGIKQRLTQPAKEARDLKAKELEEVEVEARTAREGRAQSTRKSSTRSSSPTSPAQWAAALQNALDGEVKESFNLWLEQFGVQAHQFLPQQPLVQIQAEMLSHHSPSRSPQSGTTLPVEGAARNAEKISIGSAEEDDSGRLFRPEPRFQPY